jgi:hypothetical protein
MSDAGGEPGAILDRMDAFTSSLAPTLVTFMSTLHPVLTAGTPYWLVATADLLTGQPNTQLLWFQNATGDAGLVLLCAAHPSACDLSGPWMHNLPAQNRAAFQVNSVVPEPATTALLALSSGAIWFARRRR